MGAWFKPLYSPFKYCCRGCTKKSSLAEKLAISKKSDQADIVATKSTHEMIISPKFHRNRKKIVDF